MRETVSLDGVTIAEVEERRYDLGVTQMELGDLAGYESPSGWAAGVYNDSVSESKLKRAVWVLDYVEEHEELPAADQIPDALADATVPDLETLEERRERLGVSMRMLSEAVGFTTRTGWCSAVNTGCIADAKLRKAERVLDHVAEHGRLPSGHAPRIPGGTDE